MAGNYSQAAWPVALTTPLGPDVLLFGSFEGTEGISRLFSYRIVAFAPDPSKVEFHRLLGQPMSVRLRRNDGGERHFNGICSRVAEGGHDERFTEYHLELVPPLWFLTRRVQSRIFQNKSVTDVIGEVLAGLEYVISLDRERKPRDYIVQYDETDFDFISRLMEEEGIYYFFEDEGMRHTVVMADSPSAHKPLPGNSVLPFRPTVDAKQSGAFVYEWEKSHELTSGRFITRDHSFELTGKTTEHDSRVPESVRFGKVTHRFNVEGQERLEVYDFPGGFARQFDAYNPAGDPRGGHEGRVDEEGGIRAALHASRAVSGALAVRGASRLRNLASGYTFSLQGHPNADGTYVLTEVHHRGRFEIETGGGGSDFYENTFSCIPSDVPYRPRKKTGRPVIAGPQTATVTSPDGEEIYTDPLGRVKVRFHWDRCDQAPPDSPDSTCWVRVAQMWAGSNWGSVFIPRVGMEVVVLFEQGDPDRPIIVGCLYNNQNLPPFTLPDKKNISGIVTDSTVDGKGGQNVLTFDDTKGKEVIHLHAENDQLLEVENDEAQWVGGNRKITVDGKHTEVIKKNMAINVLEGTYIVEVEKNIAILRAQDMVSIRSKEDSIYLTAAESARLAVTDQETGTPFAEIVLKKDGSILIKGKNITIDGEESVKIVAPEVTITGATSAALNSGPPSGAALSSVKVQGTSASVSGMPVQINHGI